MAFFVLLAILLSVYVVQNENIEGGLKSGYFVGLVAIGAIVFIMSL